MVGTLSVLFISPHSRERIRKIDFLTRELIKQGHRVDRIYSTEKGSLRKETIFENGEKIFLLPNAWARGWGRGGHPTFIMTFLWYFLFNLGIITIATRKKYSIVHYWGVATPGTMVSVVFLRLILRNAKFVVNLEDFIGRGGLVSTQNFFQRALGVFSEEIMRLKFFHYITAQEESIRRYVTARGFKPANVAIIEQGYDPGFFKPLERASARANSNLPPDRFIATFIGNRITSNDEKLLLEASKILQGQDDTILIVIISNSVTKSLDNRENILHLGFQPTEKIPSFLSGSDVLLLVRDDTPAEQFSMPARLPEFLGTGTPIIASAVGSVKLVAEECGFIRLVKPNDSADLASGILETRRYGQLKQESQASVSEFAFSRFSWEALGTKLLSFYKRITS